MKMLEIIETETDFSVVDDTLREPEHELVQARKQNAKLQNALREARDEIVALRAEVDKLCAPPSSYGVYLSANADDTVDVLAHGRKVKVRLNPAIKAESLRPGQELALNEALNGVAAAGYEIQGDVVVLKERLDDKRAVVTLRADGEKVGIIADPLRSVRLKSGDHLLPCQSADRRAWHCACSDDVFGASGCFEKHFPQEPDKVRGRTISSR